MQINRIESLALGLNSVYKTGINQARDIKTMNIDQIMGYLIATYGIDLVVSKLKDLKGGWSA